MSQEKVVKITNRKQFECLVSLMEKHLDVARGLKFLNSKDDFNKVWDEVRSNLNSLGPPVRNVNEWQKVWSDFKLKVKKKLAHNKKERNATGGGVNTLFQLSSLEETVSNIFSLEKLINPKGKSFGIGQQNSDAICTEESTSSRFSTPPDAIPEKHLEDATPADEGNHSRPAPEVEIFSERVSCSKSKSRAPLKENFKYERKKLLESQTEYLKGIVQNTKESTRYLRKIYLLKEEKLKLYKLDLKRKEKRSQEDSKLNMEMIEYKKKKLAIQEEMVQINNTPIFEGSAISIYTKRSSVPVFLNTGLIYII